MFRDLVNRYATPFTTGLFAVSLVSGVALFFHVGMSVFHGMHEWLSMVLILPFVLHVWKNWLPITSYLKRGWLVWPLGVSLVAALAFAVPAMTASGSGGNPTTMAIEALTTARLADLAPVLKTTPDALVARLKAAGIAATADQTPADAAKVAGKDTRRALGALLSAN